MIHLDHANDTLDSVLGSSSPATLHLALASAPPAFSNAPGDLVEPTAADYARLAVTNDATTFPSAVNGIKSNGVLLQFPAAAADWGVVEYWALIDETGAGKILYSGRSAQRYVGVGRRATFLPETLTIRLR